MEKLKLELKLVADENTLSLILDGAPLFQKRLSILGRLPDTNWMYIHKVDGILIHDCLINFKESYLNIFIADITEQLENGVDRNDLTINIPKKLSRIKCGNKIIEIEE